MRPGPDGLRNLQTRHDPGRKSGVSKPEKLRRSRFRLLRLDNPCADRVEGGLGTVRQMEFAQDIANVFAYGSFADDEVVGNLLVGETLRDETENLDFSLGEFFAGGGGARWSVQFADQLASDRRMQRRFALVYIPDGLQ